VKDEKKIGYFTCPEKVQKNLGGWDSRLEIRCPKEKAEHKSKILGKEKCKKKLGYGSG